MNWRFLIPLAAVALLIGLLAVGLTLNPREVPSPLIGKAAPAFALPELKDPQQVFTQERLVGEVSLVNVWASWCEACREEQPLLMELAQRKLFPIYGFNYKDGREEALSWLERFGDPFQTSIFDASGKVGIDWGVYGVPESFLIDRHGRIRYKHVGAITQKDLETKLLPLVEQLRSES